MKILCVSIMFLSLMPSVLYASEKCPSGEKRLHAEEECIPQTLFNYLYCLEKSGGGKVEISRKDATEKTKNLEIRLKGKGSGVVLKGEGNGGFSIAESVKAAVDINEKLDPSLASKCENILNKLRKNEKKKSTTELDKENRELKAKIKQLQDRFSIVTDRGELQKAGIEINYKNQIIDLRYQLASIHRERIVGNEEQSLFDVTKLILTPDRIRELGTSFKSLAEGAFFLEEPPLKNWQYSITSELDFSKARMPMEDFPEEIMGMSLVKKKNIHLWKAASNISLIAKPTPFKGGTDPIKLILSPQVSIQLVSLSDLISTATDFAKAKETSEQTSIARVIAKIGDVVEPHKSPRNERETASVESHKSTSMSSPNGSVDAKLPSAMAARLDTKNTIKKSDDIMELNSATAEIERLLSELFRGDAAALMLMGVTAQNLIFSQIIADTQVTLISAQKKGNVLYMKFNLQFSNVLVEGKAAPCRVMLDQEYFIVTSPNTVFLVRAEIPSFDGRSEAFAWIDSWLAGLRIPLKKSLI